MMNRLQIKGEIICDIEYHIVVKHKIIFVEEITTYRQEDRHKHYASNLLYKTALKYSNDKSLYDFTFVGVSTNDAIPFWKKIGADFAKEQDNGDCFFCLKGTNLYLYLNEELEE